MLSLSHIAALDHILFDLFSKKDFFHYTAPVTLSFTNLHKRPLATLLAKLLGDGYLSVTDADIIHQGWKLTANGRFLVNHGGYANRQINLQHQQII